MGKHYIYHIKSRFFKGDTIMALNVMKEKEPELYRKYSEKYQGREFLMNFKIPVLNCLWNDVIHCSPVNPSLVFNKLCELGFNYPPIEYFKIPLSAFNHNNTVYYRYKSENEEDKDYSLFDESKYTEMTAVPEKAAAYYKECKDNNRHPLLFHLVDHILICGEINTSGLITEKTACS